MPPIVLDGTTGITTPGLTNTGTETLVNLTTTGNTILGDASTDTLNVGNGGLIKDASGNVGVGVTPSAWGAGIKGFQVNRASLYGSGATSGFGYNYYNDGTNWKYTNTDVATFIQCGSTINFFTAPSGTAGNAITFTQAMTLDASGNLGVGTTSPAGLLEVRKDQNSATYTYITNQSTGASGQAILRMANSATGMNLAYTSSGYSTVVNYDVASGGYLASAGSGGLSLAATDSTAVIRFYSGGTTERARIDSSGNLLVGTTSSGYAFQNGFAVNPSNLSSTSTYIAVAHANGVASGNSFATFVYNAGVIGSITQNGTTGVLYNLTSDYRLKNNPTPVTGAKEFVMALQPKTWDWWDGSGKGVGFIAHEFMEVAKYSGHGEKDAVDEDGNPVYQSIQPSSSEVMANIVALIQEQQAIIVSMREEIDSLKSKVGA